MKTAYFRPGFSEMVKSMAALRIDYGLAAPAVPGLGDTIIQQLVPRVQQQQCRYIGIAVFIAKLRQRPHLLMSQFVFLPRGRIPI